VALLAAQLIRPVIYASITARRDGAPATVAMSSEVALAVDEAQYADDAGPCLDALEGQPTSCPDIAATVQWPGFREQAVSLGLAASLSVPLFAGRGVTIAALNLYAREVDALSALAPRLRAVFADAGEAPSSAPDPSPLDAGSEQFLRGMGAAFEVRATIQQAMGVVMALDDRTPGEAYAHLRARAADLGATLPATAAEVLRARAGGPV
jgi:hypothetical protein